MTLLLDVFRNDPGPPEERAAFDRWIMSKVNTEDTETTEQWARRISAEYPKLAGYTRNQLAAELCKRELDIGDIGRAERIQAAVFD